MLVNHFLPPDSGNANNDRGHHRNTIQQLRLPLSGPCRGGCDNCRRKASGELKERDVTAEARLLLSATKVGLWDGPDCIWIYVIPTHKFPHETF